MTKIIDKIHFEDGSTLFLLDDTTMISNGNIAEQYRSGFSHYERTHLSDIFQRVHNCTFIRDFDIAYTKLECADCGWIGYDYDLLAPRSDITPSCPKCLNDNFKDVLL